MSPMVQEEGTGSKLKLQVSRVIRAKREAVFNAWTKPEMIRQWFGPGNLEVAAVDADVRPNGAYRISMQGCESSPAEVERSHRSTARGTYKEIVPNELLRFTWHGDWDPSLETLVTVKLEDVEGGTRVTITHEGFVTADSCSKHEQGWTKSLENLAEYCESR